MKIQENNNPDRKLKGLGFSPIKAHVLAGAAPFLPLGP